MECAGPHFKVIGLMDDTSLIGPVTVEGENEILKGHKFPGMAKIRKPLDNRERRAKTWRTRLLTQAKLTRTLTNCQDTNDLQALALMVHSHT